MMLAEYINRKRESHYVKVVPTKTGKERYYIIKDKAKVNRFELLQDLPTGFEFYEYPFDARVVIHKVIKTNIDFFETEIVTNIMKSHKTVPDFIIDKEENNIAVYIAHLNLKDFPELKENFHLIQTFNQKLKFVKMGMTFKAQRFCFLSSHYGWITMESSSDLKYLAEKYCYHIDKESLLEFWIDKKG